MKVLSRSSEELVRKLTIDGEGMFVVVKSGEA